MNDLYPTPTRIELLRAVMRGEVFRSWSLKLQARDTWDNATVTARMKELDRAGWVRMPPLKMGGGVGMWELTDAGREILEGAR